MQQWCLVTVPRVGSIYLRDLLFHHTGHYLKKSHSLTDDKIITIARDPLEFLTSSICMDIFYGKASPKYDFSILIQALTDLYASLESSDIIIKHEDLISNPKSVAKYLSKTLDLTFIDEPFVNQAKDQPKNAHLVSSKVVPDYDLVLSRLKGYDLSAIYDIHNRMLSKSVKISGD